MKRVSLFAALLIVAPALALAQTPPPPLPPPAPPTPVVVAPVPPSAPLPPLAPSVLVPSMVDPVAIADVMRAAELASAASWVDAQAIRDAARAATDSYRFATVASSQALAGAQLKLAADMQGRQFMGGGPGSSEYNNGRSLESQRKYDEAIVRFDRVIAAKGDHVDGALYHKAWCQAKLGKADEAVATLAILKKDYGQSPYLKDARALEADVRKLGPNQVDDDDLKLLALQGIQNQNPDLAIPALENVLNKPTNSQAVRERALYVLATNDQPKAHQILLSYAKGGGNPDLQLAAISYLANRGQKTSSAELIDIYSSSANTDVRLAVIRAFRSAGAKGPLMAIASGNGFGGTTYVSGGRGAGASSTTSTSTSTGRAGAGGAGGRGAGAGAGSGMTSEQLAKMAEQSIAIRGLTDLASPTELWPLYQKEENKDLRMEWVSTFSAMGAVDQLLQIVSTEKDPGVRLRAVRSLGNTRSDKAGPALISMYAGGDKETKRAVITALGSQNNPESLIAVYDKETDMELKRQIVAQVADMAGRSPAAMDFLMKIIK
jgi:HEAT repeat protein